MRCRKGRTRPEPGPGKWPKVCVPSLAAHASQLRFRREDSSGKLPSERDSVSASPKDVVRCTEPVTSNSSLLHTESWSPVAGRVGYTRAQAHLAAHAPPTLPKLAQPHLRSTHHAQGETLRHRPTLRVFLSTGHVCEKTPICPHSHTHWQRPSKMASAHTHTCSANTCPCPSVDPKSYKLTWLLARLMLFSF